jgi:peptidoglycan/xylan/chitin deacetylase (PgdA/CDA1 family)
MPIVLMYHDVVSRSDADSSGFRGATAFRYKITPEEFRDQLDAVTAAVGPQAFALPCDLGAGMHASARFVTFDDGGASAMSAARELEGRGWRGLFFITTDRIGSGGFLGADQVRELYGRGHAIGSHSCSHPPRMSSCGAQELRREWSESVRVLSGIVGRPVTIASVPGGFYSRSVGSAAADAGIGTLFTSEPTTRCTEVGHCRIIGRYAVYRGMTPADVAALAAGRWTARAKQAAAWRVKKVAKRVAGPMYAWGRVRLLSRSSVA